MIRSFEIRARCRASCLFVILSVSLALRMLGPVGALPAEDGYVAICTGSEIVYIPVAELDFDNGAPAKKTPASTKSELCPWFFQFHALETPLADTGFVAAPMPIDRQPPTIAGPACQPIPKSFHARAPPALHA